MHKEISKLNVMEAESKDIALTPLAANAHGFVGAGEMLCQESAVSCLRQVIEDSDCSIVHTPCENLAGLQVQRDDSSAALCQSESSDPAPLCPEHSVEIIEIPLPDADTRREMLFAHLRHKPISRAVDYDALVQQTEGLSGSDIISVCRFSTLMMLREAMKRKADKADKPLPLVIEPRHLQQALEEHQRVHK